MVLLQLTVVFLVYTVTADATVPCNQRLQDYLDNGQNMLGAQRWFCEPDGSYSAVQCRGSGCYCATPDGSEMLDYFTNYGNGAEDMDCICARDKAAYTKTGLIGRMFRCDAKGSYHSVQCRGSICFCADRNGKERLGSQRVPIGQSDGLNC